MQRGARSADSPPPAIGRRATDTSGRSEANAGRALRGATAAAIHVGAPLLVGGLLYLGWRTRGLLFWDWAAALGVDGPLGGLRGGLLAAFPAPPAWVRLSLPDALWVYGLTWAVARLQAESRLAVRALWLMVPAVLGPGAELLQLVGLPGTFDPIDLGLCVGAFGLGAVMGSRSGAGATASNRDR